MPRQSTFTVKNTSGETAQSLRVRFAFARTGVKNPRIVSQPEGAPPPVRATSRGYEVDFDWGKPSVPPCEEITFSVETNHYPILVVDASWSPQSQPRPEDNVEPEDQTLFEPTGELPPQGTPCGGARGGPEEAVTRTGQGCDCKEFFKEYDSRFYPPDVPNNPNMTTEEKAERLATVGRMVQVLLARRDARAAAAKNGQLPDPANLPRRGVRDDVEHLSEAQKELFRECFPDGSGGIDYERFQLCFEQFANGELRNPANPGEREPDGGFFYLFAEFAFLAVTIAENPAVWKRLLQTFVKCQEIFNAVYRPAGLPPYRLDDYMPQNYRRGVDGDRKRRLREKYDKMTPADLERAARDNMKRAQNPAVFF